MQRGAALSWVSLHIWPSTLSFPFSSYTGKVEVMLESLLGSRAFFPSKNTRNRQVGSAHSPNSSASGQLRSSGPVPRVQPCVPPLATPVPPADLAGGCAVPSAREAAGQGSLRY